MSKIEFLDMLTKTAKRFRSDVNWFKRNSHMHELGGKNDVHRFEPGVVLVDAILVGFINTVAAEQGVDYALYTKDLRGEPIERGVGVEKVRRFDGV